MQTEVMTCTTCGHTKTVNEQNFKLYSANNYYSKVCRSCMNNRKKRSYYKNRSAINEKRVQHYKDNHEKMFNMARDAVQKRHEKARKEYEALPDDEKNHCQNVNCNKIISFSDSIYSTEPHKYCSRKCGAQAYEHSNRGSVFHDRRSLMMIGKLNVAAQNDGMLIENFRKLYNIYNFTGIPSKSFRPPELRLGVVAAGSKTNPSSLSGALNSKTRMTILPDMSRPVLLYVALQNSKNISPVTESNIRKETDTAIIVGNRRLKRAVRTAHYFMDSSDDFPTDELIEADKIRYVIEQYLEKNPGVNKRILDTRLGVDKYAIEFIMKYQPLKYMNADLARHMCNRLVGKATKSTIYEREYVTTEIG